MAELAYRYLEHSRAVRDGLRLSTSGGVVLGRKTDHPYFFSGFLTRPAVTAEALRAVALVAGSSFARRPPVSLDPVVTSHGDRLRFESFSGCGGVQARLDLLPAGFDGDVLDRGTTNVDINEPLRRYLAGVGPAETLRLSVGRAEMVVSSPGQSYVERKVRLPKGWLRGFAEVQAIVAGFDSRLELDGRSAAAFMTSLRRDASGWIVPAGRSWRLSTRPVPGAVFLSHAERLGALAPLLRHATRMRLYGPAVSARMTATASAWEVDLPGSRLVLTVSPDPYRGFAGEGANLAAVAAIGASADADRLHALLAFEPRLDLARLAVGAGIDLDRTSAALSRLAASGLVGYDLSEAAYFHRELPHDPGGPEAMNPRLNAARALVEAGSVSLATDAAEVVIEVVSESRTYGVRQRPDGTYSCHCPWWTAHHGDRGPCKHVLAATMAGLQ